MKRLMVVDDEAVITTQLEDRLQSMKYDVVGTASSAEGREGLVFGFILF